MKSNILKPIIATCVVAVMFAGCASSTGSSTPANKTATGALIGGVIGAVLGGTTSNKKGKRVAISGAAGAAIGAAIGYSLDKQANEVAKSLETEVNNNPDAEQNINEDLIVSNTDSYVKIMFRDDMMFATNSATPTYSASTKIAKLTPILKNYPDTIVQVVGHTDSKGTLVYNQGLSEKRAVSVGNTINSSQISNSVYTKGCSYLKEIAPNTTSSNMALNRRVEIYLYPNSESIINPCIK
ncbi:MAG: Outer membrane lipoprotein omp16 precursor [uncultured Campylobacterales bacterium]|uniref:Outer membrane lipoprotein omp16 n=1 Tax=uncultured Campylobacterales bacterium TaxID=352960 RepID=A0A6S6T7A1_9BACT|nr:MAG: Outer membrane lipoprotein omp16 precursor [uncultured Campylobacterales bacterium]